MSTCVDQTSPMPSREQKVFQLVLSTPLYARKNTICISTCQRETKFILTLVDQTHPIPARTTFNMRGQNPSQRSEFITCVDQPHIMPRRTQNATQRLLKKTLPCQRGKNVSQHVLTKSRPLTKRTKVHLNLFRPNTSHASEDTKCISICADSEDIKYT
jgi:hypothetical protein